MSNFSDGETEKEREALRVVLAAMADELTRTATDVEALGVTLSGHMADPVALRKNYNIQAFDLLSQAVQAQARLLKRLSDGEQAAMPEHMASMIADIPFSQTRQRMMAAVNGSVSPAIAAPHPDDSDVNWF